MCRECKRQHFMAPGGAYCRPLSQGWVSFSRTQRLPLVGTSRAAAACHGCQHGGPLQAAARPRQASAQAKMRSSAGACLASGHARPAPHPLGFISAAAAPRRHPIPHLHPVAPTTHPQVARAPHLSNDSTGLLPRRWLPLSFSSSRVCTAGGTHPRGSPCGKAAARQRQGGAVWQAPSA